MSNSTPELSLFDAAFDPDDERLPARFKAKFVVTDAGYVTPCWIWKACLAKAGYGSYTIRNKRTTAHCFAYETLHGGVPNGLELDHLCRNRSCCNPAHLEAVTHRVNQLRGYSMTGVHARKTHCARGHLFAGQNLKIRANGARICLTCRKIDNCTFSEKRTETRNARRQAKSQNAL